MLAYPSTLYSANFFNNCLQLLLLFHHLRSLSFFFRCHNLKGKTILCKKLNTCAELAKSFLKRLRVDARYCQFLHYGSSIRKHQKPKLFLR